MLDMYGITEDPLNNTPTGGVTWVRSGTDGYYDWENGGVWVPGTPSAPVQFTQVNVQAANSKTMNFLAAMGWTANPADIRVVYVNDILSSVPTPADNGKQADELEFFDGIETRRYRVMHTDARPWNNYLKMIVERLLVDNDAS